MDRAPNLVLVGPMGAGKTSIGRCLAERCGLDFVDSDQRVEASTGADVATIFDCEGEAGFRSRERELLATVLAGRGQVVATGGGAVLDAGTRKLMRERGFVVHLRVGGQEQLERLSRDRTRPLLARADRGVALEELAAARGPLYEEVADLTFDTDGLGPGDACIRLGRLLQVHWRCGAIA